jgi:cholesterol transport system auxiliary component
MLTPSAGRRSRAAGHRWLALLLAALLAGCAPALLKRTPAPASQTHLIDWRPATPAVGADPQGPGLLVGPVLSAPGFGSSNMAYIRSAQQVEYFANHRWGDAPARLLEPLLIRAADDSGLFRSVAAAGSTLSQDLRLDSRLLHLQQRYGRESGELQLALAVSLVDVASARVLAAETLRVSEPLTVQTPDGGAAAANRAVDRLMRQLQRFLAEHVRAAGRGR